MNGLPRQPPLARAGLDRAAHHRKDPAWLAQAWQRARVLIIDAQCRVLARASAPAEPAAQSGAPVQVKRGALAQAAAGSGPPAPATAWLVFTEPGDAPGGERLFLGCDQADTPYFAVIADLPAHPDASPASLRTIGAELSPRDAGLFVTAAALVNWHAAHRFSPLSGELTSVRDGGWLRVDRDGRQMFPRTDPAVIVLAHDGVPGPGGRCLLGHNAGWRRAGRPRFFSTLAGFVEPGESAEAAVVREVQEEVGVTVTRLSYEGSQAWPFPGSLMLGYTGYVDPAQPVRPDLDEIADARWFTRAEVAELLPAQPDPTGAPYGRSSSGELALPGPTSIAHFLIATWLHRGA